MSTNTTTARATTVHSRFQVCHPTHGLVSVHKNLMLALAAARGVVRRLKSEDDREPFAEVFDLMAKPNHVDLWKVTGTSGQSSDVTEMRRKAVPSET